MRVPMVTVYRLVHAGALPAVRVGRSLRVALEDASALLDGRDGADR
jgi:excisionase family DNA binding protein